MTNAKPFPRPITNSNTNLKITVVLFGNSQFFVSVTHVSQNKKE
ncbi:hypothetical protein BPJM79_60070 [Bacillus pumilus]